MHSFVCYRKRDPVSVGEVSLTSPPLPPLLIISNSLPFAPPAFQPPVMETHGRKSREG